MRQVPSISIFSIDFSVLNLGRPEFCMIFEALFDYSNAISRRGQLIQGTEGTLDAGGQIFEKFSFFRNESIS